MEQAHIMSDQDPNPNPENEQRIFTLKEAESTRREIEPLLLEAMDSRRKLADADEKLARIVSRIMVMGGILINTQAAAELRSEHDHFVGLVRNALETIQATGCVVKDLDAGLLDFPARIDGEEVYLCWRLGEDRIRYFHRQDEGFSGRRPIDPRDPGPGSQVQ
jgi:hypothetical protein